MPGVSSVINDRLASPSTIEYTAGVTRRLGDRGLVRLDGVYRDYQDFYSDRVDRTTGQVRVDVVTGQESPTGTLLDVTVTENTNDLTRTYKGLNAQLSYRVADRLDVAGNYTLSKTEGSADGETRANGAITSPNAFYAEYREPRWNTPEGVLSIDRRHRARAWAIWDLPTPSAARHRVAVRPAVVRLRPAVRGRRPDRLAPVRDRPRATPTSPLGSRTSSPSAARSAPTTCTAPTSTSTGRTACPGLGRRTELFLRATVLNVFDNRASPTTTTTGST